MKIYHMVVGKKWEEEHGDTRDGEYKYSIDQTSYDDQILLIVNDLRLFGRESHVRHIAIALIVD